MRTSPSNSGKLGEVEAVQNPALGAYLLWQFGLSFQETKSSKFPMQFIFVVLPLLFHGPTLAHIKSTLKNSGLSMFSAKLAQQKEDLLAVHERALVYRELTLQSLGVASSFGLLSIDYATGFVRANSSIEVPKLQPTPKIRLMAKSAEKLGHWFADVEQTQVATSLMVEF